jgi:glucan phosphoethanolaminetransferase (alkaline phosphatase superfamily)
MNLQIILAIIVALLGYPVGLFIAKSTKEELKAGRKWFKLIMFASIILVIISLIFFQNLERVFLSSVFVFIFLMSFASFQESKK